MVSVCCLFFKVLFLVYGLIDKYVVWDVGYVMKSVGL